MSLAKPALLIALLVFNFSAASEDTTPHFAACSQSHAQEACNSGVHSRQIKNVLGSWDDIVASDRKLFSSSVADQTKHLMLKVMAKVREIAASERDRNRRYKTCLRKGASFHSSCGEIKKIQEMIHDQWPKMQESLHIGFAQVTHHGRTARTKKLRPQQRHPLREFVDPEELSPEEIKYHSPKVSHYYFNEAERKRHKKNYFEIIGSAPILGFVSKANPSKKELFEAFDRFEDNATELLMKDLTPDDLVGFKPVIESVLAQNPEYCVIAEAWHQDYAKRNARNERLQLAAEIGVAGACLIAGLATLGGAAPICFAAGLAMTGIEMHKGYTKYQFASNKSLVNSTSTPLADPSTSIKELRDAETHLNLQTALLPLEAWGIGEVVTESAALISVAKKGQKSLNIRGNTIDLPKPGRDRTAFLKRYRKSVQSLNIDRKLKKQLIFSGDDDYKARMTEAIQGMSPAMKRQFELSIGDFIKFLKVCE